MLNPKSAKEENLIQTYVYGSVSPPNFCKLLELGFIQVLDEEAKVLGVLTEIQSCSLLDVWEFSVFEQSFEDLKKTSSNSILIASNSTRRKRLQAVPGGVWAIY